MPILIQSGRFDAGFNPLTLTPHRYYDFSDAASVTLNGSTISQINDLSGNSGHLAQATAGFQPTYTSAAQNGHNAATFDGADDRLFTSTTLTLAQPYMFFLALKTTDLGVQSNIFGQGSSPVFYRTSANAWAIWAGSSARIGGSDTNVWKIITARFDGASSYLRVNGTQVATGSPGTDGFAGVAIYLGSNTVGTQRLTGQVGEAMIAPVPSDTLRNDYETHLIDYWAAT